MLEKHLRAESQDRDMKSRESVMTFENIFRIIHRRRYGIMVVVAVTWIAATASHFLRTPEYRAVSILMINDKQDQNDLFSKVLGPNSGVNDFRTVKKDVELIRSMPIAELTVRELSKVNRNMSLELFGERPYLSSFAILLKPVLPLFAEQNPVRQVKTDESVRKLAIKLSKRIKVEPVRETNVLKVSVASPFPDEAVLLTNTLCKIYRDTDISRNAEKYSQANRFIADMLYEQGQKLAEADAALSKYMLGHKIYEVTGNTQQLLAKLVEVDAKCNDITAEYNIAKNSLSFLDSKLSEADKAISSRISESVNAQLGSIMDEIRTNENEYVLLVRKKSIDDPEVKAKKQQLDVVKSRYEQLSRSKIAGQIGYAGRTQKYSFDMVSEKLQMERKLNELNFSATEFSRLKQYYEDQLDRLPQKEQEYVKLERDRDAVSKTYVFLKEKLDESRILIGSEVGSVSVIGSSFRPFDPEKPNLGHTILLGLLFSGIVASVYTYAAETMDDTVNDVSFFRDYNGLKVFRIPFVNLDAKTSIFSKNNRVEADLHTAQLKPYPGDPGISAIPKMTAHLTSSFAESFRKLRVHLDSLAGGDGLQTILVSGMGSGDGTSTVCMNLAMAFALAGRNTLIIDCNMNRASVHDTFSIMKESGLTDYLASSSLSFDQGSIASTEMNNLFVLNAGSNARNTSEMLGSDRMLSLIQELKKRYDRILLDAPPLFLSDAIALVNLADGIVLASRLQQSSKNIAQELLDDFFLRDQIIGVTVIDSNEMNQNGYSELHV